MRTAIYGVADWTFNNAVRGLLRLHNWYIDSRLAEKSRREWLEGMSLKK